MARYVDGELYGLDFVWRRKIEGNVAMDIVTATKNQPVLETEAVERRQQKNWIMASATNVLLMDFHYIGRNDAIHFHIYKQ